MSKMAELVIEVEEMLIEGHSTMTVAQILDIPLSWVLTTAEELSGPEYDDSMFEDIPF